MSTVTEKTAKLDYFLAKRPLPGHKEFECGDVGIIKEFDNKVFIAIVDAAGHSESAHIIAIACTNFLEENYANDLVETMKGLHEFIKPEKRGAVGALCLLDLESGQLRYVAIGNVCIRKFGVNNVSVRYKDGIIGYMMPTPRQEIMKLYDGDVLLLYTDGVKAHFAPEKYPELLRDDAKTIATHIIQQFGKEEDDAACIVLRFSRTKND